MRTDFSAVIVADNESDSFEIAKLFLLKRLTWHSKKEKLQRIPAWDPH